MRSEPNIKAEPYREVHPVWGQSPSGSNTGFFEINHTHGLLRIIASDGLGWDHVSVSLKNRCPTWTEMQFVKELFWSDSETVVQFHPKKSEYINRHPFVLHLWRKQGQEYALPPRNLIG